jgi:hypothetical protein
MISLNRLGGGDIPALVASLQKILDDLQEQLGLQTQVVINNDPAKPLKKVSSQDMSVDFASNGSITFRFQAPDKSTIVLTFDPTSINNLIGFKGTTTSTSAPSTTELPSDGNWSFHINSSSSALTLSRNQGGVIKSTTMT